MHQVLSDRIIYDDKVNNNLRYQFQLPESYCSDRIEIHDIADFWANKHSSEDYEGFDQWNQLLSRQEEFKYCKSIIESGLERGIRIHLQNISCREVIEYISDLYEEWGYFTDYPRKCEVPNDSPVTCGIHIHNLLYSAKDKNSAHDIGKSYSPIRDSSDQRLFLTKIRTGVLSHICNIDADAKCIQELLQKETLSPFLLGRVLYWNMSERNLIQEFWSCFIDL